MLDIDYDRYAAAEAQLAWMNQELDLAGTDKGFDPTLWGRTVLEQLSAWAAAHDAVIGHAKLTVELDGQHFAKLSLTEAGATPTLDRAATAAAHRGRAVINARVACEPDALDGAITASVEAADRVAGATSSTTPPVSFKPGYPRPVHRLAPLGS